MQRQRTLAVPWQVEAHHRDRHVAKMARLILSEFPDVSKDAAYALLSSASKGRRCFQRRTKLPSETGDLAELEQGTQVFTGKVRALRGPFAEIVTDSGLAVALIFDGHQLREGEDLIVIARKYPPRFHVSKREPI